MKGHVNPSSLNTNSDNGHERWWSLDIYIVLAVRSKKMCLLEKNCLVFLVKHYFLVEETVW